MLDARTDNLRYAVSYCLFGRPENKNIVNTPCVTRYAIYAHHLTSRGVALTSPLSKACGGFQDAIGWKNLSTTYQSYEYCEKWPPSDPYDLQGCTECLQAEGRYYLANCMCD